VPFQTYKVDKKYSGIMEILYLEPSETKVFEQDMKNILFFSTKIKNSPVLWLKNHTVNWKLLS